MLTKGAIGNLINRYKAVLKKCNLINTFGSLAVASMLVLGGAGVAGATDRIKISSTGNETITPDQAFKDLTITGSNYGAAISNGGGLTVEGTKEKNVEFINNSSTSRGGAIYSTSSKDNKITYAYFEKNHIEASKKQPGGGAIYGTGTMTIDNSIFKYNYNLSHNSTGGHAIGWGGGKITISNCKFENNGYAWETSTNFKESYVKEDEDDIVFVENKPIYKVTNNEGNYELWQMQVNGTVAVTNGASADIVDTKFIHNTAKNGGALQLTGKSYITGTSSDKMKFEGNHASNLGGAIHLWNNGNLTIERNVSFTENTAGSGGAIALVENTINNTSLSFAEGCQVNFAGNKATKKGGAIYNYAKGTVNLDGELNFTNNTANGRPNDIYNEGTVNVLGGTTTLGGGLAGEGTVTIGKDAVLALDSDSDAPVSVEHTVVFAKGATLNVVDSALIDGSVKQVQDSVITLNDKAELTIKSTGKHIFNVQGGEGSKLTLEARTDGSFGAYSNNGLGLDYDNPESNRPVDINVGELVIKNAYEGAESPSTAIQSDGNKITLTANKMTIEGYGAGLKTDSGSNVTFNTAESLTVSGAKSSGIRADSSAKVTLKGDTDGSTIVVSGGQYGAIRITGSSEVLFDNAAGTNKVSYTNTDVPYASINVANADSKLNMIGTNLIEGNLKVTGSAAFTGATSIAGKLIGAGNVVLNDGAMTFTDTVDGFTGTFEQKGGDVALTTDNGFFGGDVNVMGGLLKYGDIDAGTVSGPTLALGSALSLKDGAGMTVGNSKTRAGADVIFASDSKLVVDGEISGGAIVSENGGSVSVADGAKLHIENAKVGKFQVTSGFTSAVINGSGWQEDNLTLTTSNVLAEAEKAEVEGNNIVVNITAKEASTVLPDLIPMNNVDTMMAEGQNDISDSAPAGIRMLSLALEKTAASDAIDTVNEVSRAAVTAGVQNTALRITDAASNTVLDHMSLASHTASVHADGADFWAAPMYGNLYTSGMNVAGNSVRGQFGGLALGADLEGGNFLGGKFRIGAALNGGGGQSETSGTVTSTQNDYDFGGLNVYAGWNNGALNVIGSLGYGFGNHEVEMGLPSSIGLGKAKADVDTTVFTADLRAEYQLTTAWVDVLPHVGVRYTALRTDDHELKVGGDVLNSVERATQNIVQFPIGVTLSKDFAFADWSVKPMVDVSVIPAAGDKKAETKVRFEGIDAWDSVNSRIMDSTSWAGTVGVQAEKGNFSLGLNYGVQTSSNETDQNIQLKFGWKF